MKKSFLITFLLVPAMVMGQGYLFDNAKIANAKKFERNAYGFSEKQPPASYSLKSYCPPSMMQDGQTCVGWSVAYGTMSTMFNYLMKVDDPVQKYFMSFDPNFLYSISVEKNTSKCSHGVYMIDAVNQAMKYGFKRLLAPPAFSDCSTKITDFDSYYSEAFKPGDYYFVDLTELPNAKEKINMLKLILASGRPMPFGIGVTNSLMGLGGDGLSAMNPLWTPKPGEKDLGGHAMTLVGYNDSKFGGAFEVMNSYGKGFGDNGFFWIKYADLVKYANEIYAFDPPSINSGYCKLGDCNEAYSVYVFEDGSFYEGTFIDGNFNGFGIYMWPDKTIYAGMWKDDDRHGKGLFIRDGSIYGVNCVNDKIVDMEELGFAAMPNPTLTKIERDLVNFGLNIKDANDPEFLNFVETKQVQTPIKK
ncbi:MAG: hypothetical protein ACU4F9_04230 [Arcticibacter sp.]